MEYFILDTAEQPDLKQIDELYTALARGEVKGEPNSKISAFLKELHSIYPHDTDFYKDESLKFYPWKSSTYEVGCNSLVLSLSSRIPYFELSDLITTLCDKFDLLLYDATASKVMFPTRYE